MSNTEIIDLYKQNCMTCIYSFKGKVDPNTYCRRYPTSASNGLITMPRRWCGEWKSQRQWEKEQREIQI